MQKLPLGIQNFDKLRKDNYLYIDKTEYAFKLINEGTYYFLSRPRSFGKSLFLDTLKCLFEGKKQLFDGLYVYDKWDWDKKYPVIKISFGGDVFKSSSHLEKNIIGILEKNATDNDVYVSNKETIGNYFKFLIDACYKKYNTPVVVLVDEYDKPILDNITKEDIAISTRDTLRGIIFKNWTDGSRFVYNWTCDYIRSCMNFAPTWMDIKQDMHNALGLPKWCEEIPF